MIIYIQFGNYFLRETAVNHPVTEFAVAWLFHEIGSPYLDLVSKN
jgi:hypothetical protein